MEGTIARPGYPGRVRWNGPQRLHHTQQAGPSRATGSMVAAIAHRPSRVNLKVLDARRMLWSE